MISIANNDENRTLVGYIGCLFAILLVLRFSSAIEAHEYSLLSGMILVVLFAALAFFLVTKNFDYFAITWFSWVYAAPLIGLPGIEIGSLGLLNMIFVPIMMFLLINKDKYYAIIIAIILVALVNVASVDFRIVASRLLALIAPLLFLLFVARKSRNPQLIMKGVIILGLLTVPLAIYEYSFKPDWGYFEDWRGLRVHGNLDHPNGYSFHLIAPLLACYALFRMSKKGIFLVLFCALLLADILTFSRAGLLSLAAGIIIFESIKDSGFRIDTRKLAFMIFLLFVLAAYAKYGIDDEKLGMQSLSERTVIWESVMPYVYAKPLFGNGVGSFELIRDQVYGQYNPHNYYITLLFELGVIGLSLYALFFTFLLKDIAPSLGKRDFPGFGAGLLVSLAASVLIYSVSGDLAFSQYYSLNAWVALGASLNISRGGGSA